MKSMSSQAWQQPFVNIFKHYGAGEWKKCTKVGDVAKIMERPVKSSVYRITGAIPSGNYIQFPKSKSLGLTGNYLYVLFKPVIDKYYSIHIDVATSDDVVIRISLSNLFKEFKSSSTWLQFPVISNTPAGSVEEATNLELKLTDKAGLLPSSSRWTLLCLDIQYALSVYLNKHFAYFKTMKFCSNMLIKNAFTSNICYEPGLDIKFARKAGLLAAGVVPLPSEMSYPLEKHEDWHQKYDYIKFPSDKKTSFRDVSKNVSSIEMKGNKNDTLGSLCMRQKVMNISELESKPKDVEDYVTEKEKVKSRKESQDLSLFINPKKCTSPTSKVVKTRIALAEKVTSTLASEENQRPLPQVLPSVGLQSSVNYKEGSGGIHVYASPRRKEKENRLKKRQLNSPKRNVLTDPTTYDSGRYVEEKDDIRVYSSANKANKKDKMVELRSYGYEKAEPSQKQTQLLPDPILSLKKVVGFGGGSFSHALWSNDGDVIIYPCYGIIVNLNVTSGKQDFLLGHNSKISALALTVDDTLLASGQSGKGSIIRLWNFNTRKCLTVFKSNIDDISRLSFSRNGKRLCCVGLDSNFKQVIVVWNIGIVGKGGKVTVIAKAHTESSFSLINNIKFVPFDDERLVSCGNHNIRIWKIKSNVLRSCPLDLGQHAAIEFTDFAFDDTTKLEKEPSKLTMYFTACNGWIYKVNYGSMKIINMKKLSHSDENQISPKDSTSLNCIALSEHFCAIGSQDGFLRLWPMNFKSVFLEAEHDSPVSVVSISDDRTKVFAGTSVGTLGFLDITNRVYTTITRSHSADVTSFSFNKCAQQIATISADNSIKLWDEETLRQVYDFQATNEKPTTICCHPMRSEFACGFKSGAIRLFSLSSTSLLYELMEHLGSVHSVLFHPSGQYLYSAGSDGTLIMYEGAYITSPYTVSRTIPEGVTKESDTAHSIALDGHGRYLAVIGTSPYLISLYGAKTLDELLHINITCMVDPKSNLVVDEATAVNFSPTGTLLAATSTSRILKLDCSTGQILSETSNIHRNQVKSLCCSTDGRYLATAGDQCIKVWDYLLERDLNFQVFIGHCSPISKLEFSPDGKHIISAGESLFVWNFLAEKSVAELYHDDQPNVQDGFKDQVQLVKSPLIPPQPVQQLGILELSASAKVDDGVLSSKEDLKTADLLEDSAIDFNIEEDHKTLAVVNVEDSDEEQPVVVVPDINATREVISNYAPPQVVAHYKAHSKHSKLAEKRYAAPMDQAGMILDAVVGCDSNGRHNMFWHPETGLFLYSSGCLLIVEVLEDGKQHILHGHTEDISTMGMKNDGQVVATGGSVDVSRNVAQICIWDLATKSCDMILEKHHSSIVSLQYSRDDRFMVSVSDFRDCSFIIWCAKDYYVLCERKTVYPVHAIRWNPFLVNELCSVGRTEGVLFWNLVERKPNYAMEVINGDIPREVYDPSILNKDMTSLCYVSEFVLLTATSYGVICVWNLNTKQCIMHWQADDSEIDVLAAIPGKLVSGGTSKKLRVWSLPQFNKMTKDGDISDLESCSIALEDEKLLDGGIVSATFDDTLDMGVLGTLTGTVWYVNFNEESDIHIVSGHHQQINQVVICCGDDKYFATCSKDGSLRLWNLSSREQTAQFLVVGQECICGTFCSRPRDLLSSDISDYNQVIHPVATQHKEHPSQCIAGYSDGTVRVFDFGRMEKLLKMKPHSSPVVKIICPIDGRVILSGSASGMLAINSMTTGLTIRILNDHTGSPISQISQQQGNHDPSSLLWLSCSKDCRISVWNANWVKDECELSDWITFPANKTMGESEKESKQAADDIQYPPTLAKFSPVDLDLLIYTGFSLQKEICFYSLPAKKVLRTVSLTEWAYSMDISPSGNLIALGFRDRLVKLVDSSVGTFQDFVGHSDSVLNTQFSNDGNKLITSSRSELLLWNLLL